jgi:hypothetical protein
MSSNRLHDFIFTHHLHWRWGSNPECVTCEKSISYGDRVVTKPSGHGKRQRIRHYECALRVHVV